MNSGQLLMLLSAYAYTYKAIYDSRSVSSQYNAAYASSQHAGQTIPQTAGPQFSHAWPVTAWIQWTRAAVAVAGRLQILINITYLITKPRRQPRPGLAC